MNKNRLTAQRVKKPMSLSNNCVECLFFIISKLSIHEVTFSQKSTMKHFQTMHKQEMAGVFHTRVFKIRKEFSFSKQLITKGNSSSRPSVLILFKFISK